MMVENINEQLILASSNGCLELVKDLIEKGADIYASDSKGWTALMWALNSGQLDVAEYLIGIGADINSQDNDKNTALMYASGGGNVEIVMFLLENNKTDFNITNENGKDFLDLIDNDTLDLAISLIDDYNKKNDIKNKIKAMIDKKTKIKEK